MGDAGRDFFEYIITDQKAFESAKRKPAFASLEVVNCSQFRLSRDIKKSLLTALASREKAGFRFRKLFFSLGKVSADSRKQLEKYVDRVGVSEHGRYIVH